MSDRTRRTCPSSSSSSSLLPARLVRAAAIQQLSRFYLGLYAIVSTLSLWPTSIPASALAGRTGTRMARAVLRRRGLTEHSLEPPLGCTRRFDQRRVRDPLLASLRIRSACAAPAQEKLTKQGQCRRGGGRAR
jgi:hypothetical protein